MEPQTWAKKLTFLKKFKKRTLQGIGGFYLTGLACLLTSAWGQGERVSAELGYTQIEFNYFGLYSRSLEEYHERALKSTLFERFATDREFKARDWSHTLDSIHYRYLRTGDVAPGDLKAFLPSGSYKNGVYVTLERENEDYRCLVFLFKKLESRPEQIADFHFHSSVHSRIRKVGFRVHRFMREYFNLQDSPGPQNPVWKLKAPLLHVTATRDDLVLPGDSLHEVLPRTTLHMAETAPIQEVNLKNVKILLFPGGSYTVKNGETLQLNAGRTALISLGRTFHLTSPSVKSRFTNAIITVHQESEMSFKVFAGRVIAKPVFQDEIQDTLVYPEHAVSRGYYFTKEKMNEETLTASFKVLLPFLGNEIIGHFKVRENTLFREPAYAVDFLRPEAGDPMDYFIGAGFADQGIPMDALQFEGESWQRPSKTITQSLNETSCYLCKPDAVGDPSP